MLGPRSANLVLQMTRDEQVNAYLVEWLSQSMSCLDMRDETNLQGLIDSFMYRLCQSEFTTRSNEEPGE